MMGGLNLDKYFVYLISDWIAPYLCGTFITPNAISFFHGIVLTYIGMVNLYYYRAWYECMVVIYLRCLLDALDGSVARACHNGSPYGDLLDTALDAIPSAVVLFFAWRRVTWPSMYHKIGVILFYILVGLQSGSCNHDPTVNLFCFWYYPNTNVFVFCSIMALKTWSMNHRIGE